MRGRNTYRYAREERTLWLSKWSFALALIAAVMLLSAPLGYRFDLITLGTAFGILMRYAAYVGLAAAVLSLAALVIVVLTARRGVWLAVCGLLLGGASWAIPFGLQRQARTVPPIHDITTDPVDPPQFVAVVPLRADAPNPVAYGGAEVAAQQRRGYPDLAPITLPVPPAQAFERALAAARDLGWDLVAIDQTAGRLEATDTTFWFGFKDDVVVRIRPEGSGSRVDVRSLSRVGGSDIGANAARIREFREELLEGVSGP